VDRNIFLQKRRDFWSMCPSGGRRHRRPESLCGHVLHKRRIREVTVSVRRTVTPGPGFRNVDHSEPIGLWNSVAAP
jgi:hypothetical protein